jgi:NADPH2:quinone reductase
MPDPEPGDGEVRIALRVSGMNPGDMKKRAGWQGSVMSSPRVIPHSDGAGTLDRVGSGVDRSRIGQRVWVYGAQSYRPFGTAAEYVVVPQELAVEVADRALGPGDALDDQAACLGIAGITAHRAVFADGPVRGLNVLVHGAVGGVGSIATQLARRDGALVIAVVLDQDQLDAARALGAHHAFLNTDHDLARRILDVAPSGVNRVAEVDFAGHADLDAEILAIGGVVSSYMTSRDRPEIPYWAFGFKDATLRLLGSDDFPPAVKATAAKALTDALVAGELKSTIAARYPLEEIAAAHELIETGVRGRVILDVEPA